MGLQTAPGYIGQGGFQTPVELDRNFVAALAGRRTGAFRYNDFALTPSGAAMQMTIARGEAVILGNASSTTQGGYFAWSDASEVINWPASAGSPRIDSLILRVIDTQYGVDAGGNQAVWQVVSGTPSGSPVAVADSAFAVGGPNYRPGAWWRVADVLIPASVTNLSTATITYTRKYARINRHTFALSTDLPTDKQLGDTVSVIDQAGKLLIWDGNQWRGPEDAGGWTALPLAATFSDGNTLSGAGSPEYRLRGRQVEMRGTVRKTDNSSMAGNVSQTLATLPVGSRPVVINLSTGVCQWGTSVNANVPIARREIGTDGTVKCNPMVNTTWFDLGGIKFEIA